MLEDVLAYGSTVVFWINLSVERKEKVLTGVGWEGVMLLHPRRFPTLNRTKTRPCPGFEMGLSQKPVSGRDIAAEGLHITKTKVLSTE